MKKIFYILIASLLLSCSSTQKVTDDVRITAFAKAKKDSTGTATTSRTDFGTVNIDELRLKYTPTDIQKPIQVDNGKDTIYVYNATVEKHYISSKERKAATESKTESATTGEATEVGQEITQESSSKKRKGMSFMATVLLAGGFIFLLVLVIILWFFNKKINQLKFAL